MPFTPKGGDATMGSEDRIEVYSIVLVEHPSRPLKVLHNDKPRGSEVEIFSVSGYSRGAGVFIRIDGKTSLEAGSFNDVERVVRERFGRECTERGLSSLGA